MENLNVQQLYFSTSQEAWETLNETYIKGDPKFFGKNKSGTLTSGVAYGYNIFLSIRKAWMDPDFNFGTLFNYQQTKWTILVNNYVNMNQLDLIRSQIRDNDVKRRVDYNVSFTFTNTHVNGKGCLMNATFSRRLDIDIPVITATLRSSEITKRLAFDLVLLQRLGEYVYGEGATFMLQLYCIKMYANVETLLHYELYKPIKRVMKSIEPNPWNTNLLKTLIHFKTVDEKKIKYKVYRRVVCCLQPGSIPEKKERTLKTSQLLLTYDSIPYPEDCISYSNRLKFRRMFLAKNKKKC